MAKSKSNPLQFFNDQNEARRKNMLKKFQITGENKTFPITDFRASSNYWNKGDSSAIKYDQLQKAKRTAQALKDYGYDASDATTNAQQLEKDYMTFRNDRQNYMNTVGIKEKDMANASPMIPVKQEVAIKRKRKSHFD